MSLKDGIWTCQSETIKGYGYTCVSAYRSFVNRWKTLIWPKKQRLAHKRLTRIED